MMQKKDGTKLTINFLILNSPGKKCIVGVNIVKQYNFHVPAWIDPGNKGLRSLKVGEDDNNPEERWYKKESPS